MIRDFVSTIDCKKSRNRRRSHPYVPTRPMLTEAASAGQYHEEGFAPVPRVQIVTVEEATHLRDRAV